jgi:anti-anti-sigma regulatory factor
MPRSPIASSRLVVRSQISGTQATVFLSGSAEAVGIDELRAILQRAAIRRPKCLTFDVSQLETLWSLVLGEMISAARAVKQAGGSVKVAGATGVVRHVLLTCRMHEVFEGLETGNNLPSGNGLSLN